MGSDLDLPETPAAAEAAHALGLVATRKQQALLAGTLPVPRPAYLALYYDRLGRVPEGRRFQYLVVDALDPEAAPAAVRALAARGELLAELRPGPLERVETDGVNNGIWFWNTRRLERAGPLVRIYRLPDS
jgi:hypothetical protein